MQQPEPADTGQPDRVGEQLPLQRPWTADQQDSRHDRHALCLRVKRATAE
jgi:hypothetical protein